MYGAVSHCRLADDLPMLKQVVQFNTEAVCAGVVAGKQRRSNCSTAKSSQQLVNIFCFRSCSTSQQCSSSAGALVTLQLLFLLLFRDLWTGQSTVNGFCCCPLRLLDILNRKTSHTVVWHQPEHPIWNNIKLQHFKQFSLTLSPPVLLRLYNLPYWSNQPFLIFDILALRTERQSARMSKIKNGGLDQYGAEAFEQQHFGTVGIEGVNR